MQCHPTTVITMIHFNIYHVGLALALFPAGLDNSLYIAKMQPECSILYCLVI